MLCVDRDEARAVETVELIRDTGGTASALGTDISDPSACQELESQALAHLGGIDILVNNVGIGGHGDGPAHLLDDDGFELILDVNLVSMWRTCKAILPTMREQRRGSIVNISSAASIAGGFQTAYEVSKAGVNRLTTSIAQANASRGVRCNAIALGFVDTPMAVGGIAAARGVDTDVVRQERNQRVPLAGGMGISVGCGERRAVPRLRRGALRHRRDPPGRRRHRDSHRLTAGSDDDRAPGRACRYHHKLPLKFWHRGADQAAGGPRRSARFIMSKM